MKTGNAILASFFFGMAIYVPMTMLSLINQYTAIIRYLPPGLDSISFVIIIFIIFVIFGAIMLVFGREKSKKTDEERYSEPEEDTKQWMATPKEKLEYLEETKPHPDAERKPKKTKIRFDRPDENIDLTDLIK